MSSGGRWAQTSDIEITSPPLSRLRHTSSCIIKLTPTILCHSLIGIVYLYYIVVKIKEVYSTDYYFITFSLHCW